MAAQPSDAWEINLGGDWKKLGQEESTLIQGLQKDRKTVGVLRIRGADYEFDLAHRTQTNLATRKVRSLRPPPPHPGPLRAADHQGNFSQAVRPAASPALRPSTSNSTPFGRVPEEHIVEVWLAGEWKKLEEAQAREILKRKESGERQFKIQVKPHEYVMDLDQMTQTNVGSGRTRTIRIVKASVVMDAAIGFDEFRRGFHETKARGARGGERPQGSGSQPGGRGVDAISKQDMIGNWTDMGEYRGLVEATAAHSLEEMMIRRPKDGERRREADLMEWIHYWALERDCSSYFASKEMNDKLARALVSDPQILGRMQMHFETAVGETGSTGGLSSAGLLRACQRLVTSPKDVLEKHWAKEVLRNHERGVDVLEEDEQLSYYDFLNVMLGRKKFNVSLWMYDISNGSAARFSWLLLGHHFQGIWHTSVVIEWGSRAREYWFGGQLFESKPGTTPFGQPLERRPLGCTYKTRDEVWSHCRRHLASEFRRENYDVLTHNCNHFSEKLVLFLRNDHIPEEVLKQPDLVMSTLTARALRPLLNHWLGGMVKSEEAQATDGGVEASELWQRVAPGCMVEFASKEGGRPLVGEVIGKDEEGCTVAVLDFWRQGVSELRIARTLVGKVLRDTPSLHRPAPQ